MTEDYYAILDVDPDASQEAILRAYRERAAEAHPDVNDAADAPAEFRRLKQAKDVLTDDRERRTYDRLGHEEYTEQRGEDPVTTRSPSTAQHDKRGRTDQTRPGGGWTGSMGLADLLDRFYQQTGGGPTSGAHRAEIPFTERTAHSAGREFDLESVLRLCARGSNSPTDTSQRSGTETRSCPKCDGRGTFVHISDTMRGRARTIEPCERCTGTGTVSD